MSARSLFLAGLMLGLSGVVLAAPAHAQEAAKPADSTAAMKKPTVIKHSPDDRLECLKCHQTATDSTKAVPEDHAERTNEVCLFCHAEDAIVQSKDPVTFSHTLRARSNCLMCHNGTHEKAKAAPEESHKAMLDSKYCQLCHKQVAPQP